MAPTVVVGATFLDIEAPHHVPRGARTVGRRALAGGWRVIGTVALGVDTFKRKIDDHMIDVTDFVETYAVRMQRDGAYQFGVWREGKFERGYCLCRSRGIHHVAAAQLGTVSACTVAGSDTITLTSST